MKYLVLAFLLLAFTGSMAQTRVNPMITSTGGIFNITEAVEKPEPGLDYKIVIDMPSGSKDPAEMAFAINNMARMINLHVVGGATKFNIIGVIHASNTYSILSEEAYMKKYGVSNPNAKTIKELTDKGTLLFVCGQSLIARGVDPDDIMPEVKIATSALTVLTTYQLKGFAHLRF